jgi:glycosyltransferase involved in cell wall biosynthesis
MTVKLRVISLIRDEIDIVGTFLGHLDSLFDEVILLDHQSIDGTTEILRQAVSQRPNWRYYRVDIKQNMQKQLMNFFIKKFSNEKFDYLFFLDCDEFLWVNAREELETLLVHNQNDIGVYGFQWVNAISRRLDTLTSLDKNTSFFVSRERSRYQKVAINWKQINTEDLFISEGNHYSHRVNGEIYQNDVIGTILHIPIRSKKQLISKTLLSKCSMVMEANRDPSSAYQYSRFLEKIVNNELQDGSIFRSMYYYQVGDDPIPMDWETEFIQQCNTKKFRELGIAHSNKLKLKTPKKQPTIERKIANALLNGKVIDPCSYTILINGETIVATERIK